MILPATMTYCSHCGHTPLIEKHEGGRTRKACPNCGSVYYDNPVPAVGIVIEMAGGIVLIRRNNPPHQGMWALPSGYIEADETTEEAAIREAAEETGLQVELIDLAAVLSFPEGPPRTGIMLFYRARPVGGALVAGDDAGEAQIVMPADLPLLPFRTHREMIAAWVADHHPAIDDGAPYLVREARSDDAHQLGGLLAMTPPYRAGTREAMRDGVRALLESERRVWVAETRQMPATIVGMIAPPADGAVPMMIVLPLFRARGVEPLLRTAMLETV